MSHEPATTLPTGTRVHVVGAGTMGRGIAQLFAKAGHDVRCVDARPGAAVEAVEQVLGVIGRLVEKDAGKMVQAAAVAARPAIT